MLQQTLTRPTIKTTLRPLMLTSIELVCRTPDEYHLDQGHLVFDEKTVTILSREPLHPTAIRNVTKQNKGYRFESVRCEPYTPVIDVIGYTGTHF